MTGHRTNGLPASGSLMTRERLQRHGAGTLADEELIRAHGERWPRVHDIDKPAERIRELGEKVPECVEAAKELSDFRSRPP